MEISKTINDIVGCIDDHKLTICTHDTPDPDAIASGFGLQWLLKKKFNIESSIYYGGEVSHPQNKTLVNKLNIPLIRNKDENKLEFDKIAVVDGTVYNSFVDHANIVIDHHKSADKVDGVECSVIEPVGSCCTLIVEFIKELKLEFVDDIDANVATALYIGIITDTCDLISDCVTDRDYDAARYLTPYINRKVLKDILEYPIPGYIFDLEKCFQSDENNRIEGSCWVGTVGIITPGKRDALPILAEKMLRREGIETSVVICVIDNNIEASVRSRNASLNVNDFCHNIFGKDHSGGKLGSGGAKCPLGVVNLNGLPDDIRDDLWQGIRNTLFYRILHVVGGN